MTYLSMINNLLTRLRERPVETANQTTYSSLLGLFVDDAVNIVETAWDWSALRTTLSATTSNGVFSYELQNTRQNLTILDVINDTSDIVMEYKEALSFNKMFLTSAPEVGSPRYYSFNGITDDGDTLIDIYPIPDKTYYIRFNVIARTLPSMSDDSLILVPNRPIEQLAYAMAVEERGEDGGTTSISAYTVAERSLADAVALDAGKHPEETIWYEE